MVNPSVDQTLTVASPRNASTADIVDLSAAGCELLVASAGVNPVASASGVQLPAGAFALYGRNAETAVTDIAADAATHTVAVSSDRRIIIEGAYSTASVADLAGRLLPLDSPLTPGLYIVTVDGLSHKLLVK